MEKHKFASIFLTVRDRVISSKFSTHRVSNQCTLGSFQKMFPLPKNGGHFEFLPKMEKHKFPSISLTVQDRMILSKFSTHRVSNQCTLGNFQKMFLSPNMAAILNSKHFSLPKNGSHFEFSNFCQKCENTNFSAIYSCQFYCKMMNMAGERHAF